VIPSDPTTTLGAPGGVPATLDTAAPAAETVGPTASSAPAPTLPPTTGLPPTTVKATPTPPGPSTAPEVDARAYAVLDVTNQRWLAESAADEQRPVGSIIKLLTALVVMRAGDPDHEVTVGQLQLDPDESQIGLYEGEQLSRAIMLRAMLIVSANDAARALAADVGGSEEGFVTLMNQAAADLGLSGTAAMNSYGLDATGAHSTARDVANLAGVLMQDETFRATVVRTTANLHGMTFVSTNQTFLTTYPGAEGVKTGHTTEAGFCLVAAATHDGRRLIAVVLGSSSDPGRVSAASSLLDWGFNQP
jgi:D-alanyl-D-alanine carboxypeptidase